MEGGKGGDDDCFEDWIDRNHHMAQSNKQTINQTMKRLEEKGNHSDNGVLVC
jgi:hypothetical protein